MDTDTFSLCPFDTAIRPVVGLSNYSRMATRQELCRVHSEIAGWVAVSVSAQVDTDPMFSTSVSVSVSISTPHKWTRSLTHLTSKSKCVYTLINATENGAVVLYVSICKM